MATRSLSNLWTYKLHRLKRIIDKHIAEEYLVGTGLALREARTLAAIGAFGPLSLGDVARGANLDKSQASRGVDALLSRKLVARKVDAHDARAVSLTVTAEGEKAYKVALKTAAEWHYRLSKALTAEERVVFEGMLDRIIKVAEEWPPAE
ncbi:MAG: MarR family transcriptional regulator [Pseudomonadota bacterium]